MALSLLVAYTFPKLPASPTMPSISENIQDVFNRGLERSITNYHFPQFLKVAWIYELPIGPGKRSGIGGIAGKAHRRLAGSSGHSRIPFRGPFSESLPAG